MSDTKSSNPKDVLAAEERRCLLHLIPSPGLIATALAMQNGAEKYGPYNWREEGVGACTYLSAAMRHIRTWLDGEEDASDSGVHHLGHAAACLMILLDSQAVGNLVDDRPAPAPTGLMLDHVKSGYHPSGIDVPDEPIDDLDERMSAAGQEIVNARISGFAEHADPDAGTPFDGVIKAEEVYVSDPFMEELGFKPEEENYDPEPNQEIHSTARGVELEEEMTARREEIIEELNQALVKDPEKYIADTPNLAYRQVARKLLFTQDVAGYHWTYDAGCPCRRCVEESYSRQRDWERRHPLPEGVERKDTPPYFQRKKAESPEGDPTSNPNGGCC